MSWIQRANRKIEFFLGDGKSYFPEYFNATKVQDFNVSIFDFINVTGSLVRRKKPKGRKFNIEIIFQGEDHIDLANEFETSADDPRHWHIRHPIYDDIRCQPVTGLKYDNTVENITKITGTVIETILGAFPKGLQNPQDEIRLQKESADTTSVFAFANQTVINGDDTNVMNTTVDILESNAVNALDSSVNVSDYISKAANARAAISKATSQTLDAMASLKEVINAPILFNVGVFATQKMLLRQFDQTRNLTFGEDEGSSASVTNRKNYEAINGIIVSTMLFNSSVPQPGDYQTRPQVMELIELLISIYNQYVEDLDALQLADFASTEIYIPDYEAYRNIEDLFNTSLGNLYEIAFSAQQEKILVLSKDSNIINVTHLVYGLDNEDANIERLISTNEMGLNEHLQVKKGREIKYYV